MHLHLLRTDRDVADVVAAAVTGAEPHEVMPPLDGPPGWTPERTAFCHSFYADRTGGLGNERGTAAYAIVEDGTVAGFIRLSRRDGLAMETGMWIARDFRGRGLAVAAVRALLAEAARAGARTVVAETRVGNGPARATLARAGATLVERDDRVQATFDVSPAALNRANWNARAAVHGQDPYYDSAGLIAGADSLTPVEWDGVRRAVGSVDGLDVLHVQCHLGFDSITLARHGARVVGVDFAAVALTKARALADHCGVSVDWVEADSTDLPASLHGRFDLAYATIGVLCWIGDVEAWMRSVAATLRPGGRLLLIDGHPLSHMVAGVDPLRLGWPYGYDGPHVEVADGTYADPDATVDSPTNVQFAHSLGEIVTAAVDAGLRIERLDEHTESWFQDWAPEADGRYRLRVDGHLLPVLFTLIASRSPQL